MALTHPPNDRLVECLGVALEHFRRNANERGDPRNGNDQSADEKNPERTDKAVRALIGATQPPVPQRFEDHFSPSGERSARRSVRRRSPPRRSSGDRARSQRSVMNAVKPSISQYSGRIMS